MPDNERYWQAQMNILRNMREQYEKEPVQSESEKFFAHLNNGEVYLEVAEMTNGIIESLNVVITPKEAGE